MLGSSIKKMEVEVGLRSKMKKIVYIRKCVELRSKTRKKIAVRSVNLHREMKMEWIRWSR